MLADSKPRRRWFYWRQSSYEPCTTALFNVVNDGSISWHITWRRSSSLEGGGLPRRAICHCTSALRRGFLSVLSQSVHRSVAVLPWSIQRYAVSLYRHQHSNYRPKMLSVVFAVQLSVIAPWREKWHIRPTIIFILFIKKNSLIPDCSDYLIVKCGREAHNTAYRIEVRNERVSWGPRAIQTMRLSQVCIYMYS